VSSTLRLAARLCFAWGIEDVEAWLEGVEPRVLEFWQAFDFVEPIGEQWRQTAETNKLLSRVVELMAARFGIEMEPTTIEELMPQRYKPEKKPKKEKPSKAVASDTFMPLAAMFGLKEVVDGRSNQSS
jgi:hypothetical protein